MVKWDQDEWTNWARDVIVKRPERRCYPACRDDLLSIVCDAEAQRPPRRLHASGSHWSFSDIAVSEDWIVETAALRATLYDVIPAALHEQARDDLLRQSGTGPVYGYYHVEAGITIRDLNLRLDRQPLSAADRDWARMPVDAITDSWPGAHKRWALPTMGGASGQTLAGAISTGTHGGDHGQPPMADMVRAIHLIGPGGRQWWIERDTGITHPDRLRATLPGIQHCNSTDMFNAVLVSMGRMGFIYSLVLRVVEQFWLEQTTTVSTWEREAASLLDPFPAFDRPRTGQDKATRTRFLETLVLPYPRRDGTHTCYQTAYWTVPAENHNPRPKGPGFFALLCRHSTITPILVTFMVGTVAAIAVSWLIPVVGMLLVSVELLALLTLAGLLPFARMSLGGLLARACNFANRIGRSWLVRRVLESVISRARPRATTCDVGYEVMDLSETGGECYRTDPMEASFDARTGAHVAFLNEDVFPAFEQSAKAGRTVAGYISLRFTRRSSALMSMQRWDVTCAVEVALLKGIDGNAEVLHNLQEATLRRGGTIHWGQRNTLDAKAVASSFPELGRWRAQLAKIVEKDGPDTFRNAFCADRGLDP